MRLDGLFHFALVHAGTAAHCGGEHCAHYAHCAHCGEHCAVVQSHCLVAHRISSSQCRSLESPHMAAVREWQRNMAAISWQPYHHGGTKGIDLFPDNC